MKHSPSPIYLALTTLLACTVGGAQAQAAAPGMDLNGPGASGAPANSSDTPASPQAPAAGVGGDTLNQQAPQDQQGSGGAPSGTQQQQQIQQQQVQPATGADPSYMQPLPMEPTRAGYSSNSSSGYEARDSWIPYTTAGYVGIAVGNGKIHTDCIAGQTCDDPDWAASIYTGGMFSPYLGLQFGYLQLGEAERNGGLTKVRGVNLALTGLVPLGTNFSLVGRLGGTYGWTETSVGPGVPVASGDKNGFGVSYGAGLSWDFNRNWSVTLDWDRHRLKFAGDVTKNTDIAGIGIKYRF